MPKDEDHDLLSGLQAPSVAAAERAKELYDQLIASGVRPEAFAARTSAAARNPASAATTALAPWPAAQAPSDAFDAPLVFAGGRRYDVALSLVPALQRMDEETTVHDDDDFVPEDDVPEIPLSEPEASEELESTQVYRSAAAAGQTAVERPPPGAPTVRKAAPVDKKPDAISQELLEASADTAMLMSSPDGSTSFDISFRDDVFADLACNISFNKGRVVATFRVRDDNIRRLIEAESGRLRSGLEARGLKVEEVRVEIQRDRPAL